MGNETSCETHYMNHVSLWGHTSPVNMIRNRGLCIACAVTNVTTDGTTRAVTDGESQKTPHQIIFTFSYIIFLSPRYVNRLMVSTECVFNLRVIIAGRRVKFCLENIENEFAYDPAAVYLHAPLMSRLSPVAAPFKCCFSPISFPPLANCFSSSLSLSLSPSERICGCFL